VIPYSFHPEAETELADAAIFYESRMVGLGRSFATEVEKTVSLIREYPDAGMALGVRHRRMLVHGFPYTVVYQRNPEAVFIIAVAHHSRRPTYWRRRK
jgi:toxin ParE1/3/4